MHTHTCRQLSGSTVQRESVCIYFCARVHVAIRRGEYVNMRPVHCVSNKSGVHVNYARPARHAEQFNPGWALDARTARVQKSPFSRYNNYCVRTRAHLRNQPGQPSPGVGLSGRVSSLACAHWPIDNNDKFGN